ncbi:enoyl-CoA hydratase/isomerase family protein [Streptomyces sp. NPDC047042]|uniref:enoyl-CoA hydratase/isomerase family protein n=1 Tax=Streptomyces sp. NPDC047042 TaxID=3154807 RepID=UPI0033F8FD0B
MRSSDGDSVIVRRDGPIGRIVLNRPKVLNALTHTMVRRIAETLDIWEHDERVRLVLLTGAGERGLCAGGDIRDVHRDATAAGGEATRRFWRDEYRLNARISSYPKPYVAVMDGIVMGGGIGLSAHGAVRIVTERTTAAMPETTIGLVPDVGGTYLLSRAPGELGTHLALTAGFVGAGDAHLCGLADHFVPSADLDALIAELAEDDLHQVLARHVLPTPSAELAEHQGWIDECYAAGTVEEVVFRLVHSGHPAAAKAAVQIKAKCPTAVKVTFAALRRARELPSLEAVLDQEYRVSCRALATSDLVEGIRAQVIDKDRSPRWNPPTLQDVSDAAVSRFFAPLEDEELGLSVTTAPKRA